MRNFISKFGKTTLLVVLSVLLIVAIIKIVILENKLNESLAAVVVLDQRITSYNKNIAKYESVVDSLNKKATEKNIILVTKTDLYEKTKNTPINTTLTDCELIDRLKKFRARYKEENGIGSSH